jgi:peptidoglycan hydrolase-like protein with peptidoglycan-binding domain
MSAAPIRTVSLGYRGGPRPRRVRLRCALSGLAIASLLASAGAGSAAASTPARGPTATASPPAGATAPSRATVIEVQRLFEQLGYPLGPLPLGGLGPRTKGALRYFQRKYGLPVTGLADPHTIVLMRTVAASLRGPAPGASSRASQTHDVVEDVLGNHVPILAIAVGLAALLALLALSARERPA